MYCIYCGTDLGADIDVCPYCRKPLKKGIQEIEYYNKDKLRQVCPDIREIVHFHFREYEYSFNLRYSRLINSYRFFEKILYINKKAFIEKMVRIQNFNTDYADRLVSLAMEDLKKTALLTETFFCNENIHEDYREIYRVYENIIRSQFQEIALELREMDKQKEERDANRSNEYETRMDNNYRTRWIGGGYGVSGAIRGSLQASMMNAGTSMVTGAASTIGYISSTMLSNSQDRKVRSKRFNSDEFRIGLAEKYNAAIEKILQWNCCKIDKELTSSLFKGELYKRAKSEMKCLFSKTLSNEEIIQKCCSIISYNPYYFNLYVYMYKEIERITSEELLSIVTQFCGNLFGIKYAFMQEDMDLIKKNTCFLDDSEQLAQEKFHNLQKLAQKNTGYCDFDLAAVNIACNFKDGFVRNWFQAVGNKVRDTVGYCNVQAASPIQWDYAETNAAYAYTVYRIFETQLGQYDNSANVEKKILDENSNLQKQVQSGNKTAICIWAALHAKCSIAHRKPASKFIAVVWKLAAQKDALAMAVVGSWFDQGIADCPENRYAADMFLRMAMLQGSPYAIAYIGYYYKKGFAGYTRDKDFADELFHLAREVPLAKNKGEF